MEGEPKFYGAVVALGGAEGVGRLARLLSANVASTLAHGGSVGASVAVMGGMEGSGGPNSLEERHARIAREGVARDVPTPLPERGSLPHAVNLRQANYLAMLAWVEDWFPDVLKKLGAEGYRYVVVSIRKPPRPSKGKS